MEPRPKKKKPFSPVKYWLLNHLGVPLVWWIFAAYSRLIRLRVKGMDVVEELSGKPFVFVLAHGDMVTGVLAMMRMGWLQKLDNTWLTSPSDDGQLQARILQRAGAKTVIGSSSKRSREGLLALHRDLKSGRVVCLAVDGPRGPAMVAKPGAGHLAVEADVPIMLIDIEPERSWRFPDWAKTHFPKPFSVVRVNHQALMKVESVEAGSEWLTEIIHANKGVSRKEAS